jgi:hypothetical protein
MSKQQDVLTGRLELYNNGRLKYLLNLIHFLSSGMFIRLIISVLCHNANHDREPVAEHRKLSKA